MGNKAKILIAGLIAILTVIAAAAVVNMNKKYDVMDDITDVKERAVLLYESGDIQSAIQEMDIYCRYVSTDIEAKTTLGDWYAECGNDESAYQCYYDAASNKAAVSEIIPPLGVKNTDGIILAPINDVVMEITCDVRATKDMKLTITGHNLVSDVSFDGRIEQWERELYDEDKGYLTTDWFAIDPDGEYLTMSGGFNTAMWQFKNAAGEITHYAVSTNTYREKDSVEADVYQMARAEIPEKATWCRVTYYDTARENKTASPEEELTIVYGRMPGESKAASYAYYEIPDLKEGDKIVYKNGGWSYTANGIEMPLYDWPSPMIEKGSYISVSGTLPGKVSFEKSSFAGFENDGIYSVTFDNENPSAMGNRGDDAKNLGFNAAVAEGTIALGENHFDNIYPWKDMKLCNIKDGNVTAYEGEEGFSSTGDNGDVFVEIPKFYVRRIVEGNLETISISGFKHDGFDVDPAFVKDGKEADCIYVAAYLTSTDENGAAQSVAGTNVTLDLSYDKIKNAAEAEGYSEIDYNVLMCIQRLFMVETGLRNSQYLYMGACGYTSLENDFGKENYAVATESNEKTNCIVVSTAYHFEAGNSIIIFDKGDANETFDDIRQVKTVISNNDGTQSVYVDGDSFNVYENVTAAAHTALKNGTSRSVSHHTGAMSTARGSVAFKYRNIENLWGNAYVYIDGISVYENRVTVVDRNGQANNLAFVLPEADNEKISENMIKKLGYDPKYPYVMLPDTVGEGASGSTYFGDCCLNIGERENKVLLYGGSWSSKACAGLFCYKFCDGQDNVAGRMMYIK